MRPAAGALLAALPWLCATLLPSPVGARASSDLAPPSLRWLDEARAHGCQGHVGSPVPLRRPQALQAAAARWAAGAPLPVAIERAGYRAERSQALQYRGSESGLRGMLTQRLCRLVVQRPYRDVGVHAHGDEVWIVLAEPFEVPAAGDAAAVQQQLLERINAARSRARRCGSRRYAPAVALQVDARLNRAAARHAEDMLEHDFFDHRGSNGSTPATRVLATGYRFRLVGENIALGPESPAEAVQGWLASPEHCANIMDPVFRQTGFAFAANRRGNPRIYWVEDFGTPAH